MKKEGLRMCNLKLGTFQTMINNIMTSKVDDKQNDYGHQNNGIEDLITKVGQVNCLNIDKQKVI